MVFSQVNLQKEELSPVENISLKLLA